MSAFMTSNGMKRGILFTADPYSKIIDANDRNTVMLFGDAASATLLERDESLPSARAFRFATDSRFHRAIIAEHGKLAMNGREVFNYCAQAVPPLVNDCLTQANLEPAQIDWFLLHQGSRFIVDTLVKRMSLPPERVPVELGVAGNTVSSSIPLMLAGRIARHDWRYMLLCGFGVGLSAAACVLERAARHQETR